MQRQQQFKFLALPILQGKVGALMPCNYYVSFLRKNPSHPRTVAVTSIRQEHICGTNRNTAKGFSSSNSGHRDKVASQGGKTHHIMNSPVNPCGSWLLSGGGIHDVRERRPAEQSGLAASPSYSRVPSRGTPASWPRLATA